MIASIGKIHPLPLLLLLATWSTLLLLAGCGSGNSSVLNPLTTTSNTAASVPVNLPVNSTQTSSGQSNVMPLYVDGGIATLASYPNGVFTNVTVCLPATRQCNTIDHVLVDTGSVGLRLLAHSAGGELTLPLPAVTENGKPLYECLQFADGYTWGSINSATVQLGQETTPTLPIQVIGNNTQLIPPSCTQNAVQNTPENDLASLGTNGILGVGVFTQDCGATGCMPLPYYACTTTACNDNIVPALQNMVQNPVSMLPQDNNGLIMELPAIPTIGSALVNGQLLLGVNTRSDNQFPTGQLLTLDPSTGYLGGSTWNGNTFATSYVDSGTSVFEVGSTLIKNCSSISFSCPTATLPIQAAIFDTNGVTQTISFDIANATALFNQNPNYVAFNDLGATAPDNNTLVLGMPFFYGTQVAELIGSSNGSTGGQVGFTPLQ